MMQRASLRYGVNLTSKSMLKQSPTALSTFARLASQASGNKTSADEKKQEDKTNVAPKEKRKKTLAELDEELRSAMEGHSGDGGIAGAELEGGKAVGMKRSVKENMFRYI